MFRDDTGPCKIPCYIMNRHENKGQSFRFVVANPKTDSAADQSERDVEFYFGARRNTSAILGVEFGV